LQQTKGTKKRIQLNYLVAIFEAQKLYKGLEKEKTKNIFSSKLTSLIEGVKLKKDPSELNTWVKLLRTWRRYQEDIKTKKESVYVLSEEIKELTIASERTLIELV
jgi:hypothetical protein